MWMGGPQRAAEETALSGVFGQVATRGGDSNPGVVERMAGCLRHHDWHVVETASPDPAVAAGRVGIGIFNREPQPERSADGAISLWLSGEFHHARDTRARLVNLGAIAPGASNAALALAVYHRDGPSGLTQLQGTFLIAVWDGRTREFLIVNDRFGLYSLFYAHAGGALTFAPEIKAVLCAPAVPRTLDRVAVAQFVRFQQALSDRTWLEEVRLLPPASLLRYRPDDDRLMLEKYWDWNDIGWQSSITFGEAVEGCVAVFQRAIDTMTQPPHRLGIFLSGGLDGRAILGFTRPSVPVTTVTYGAEGCRDVVYAARLARIARRPHKWVPFEDGRWVQAHASLHVALTSGLHGWTNAHGISILPEVRRLIDVNLSGYDGSTTLGAVLDGHNDSAYRDATTEADLVRSFYKGYCQEFTWPGLTDVEAEHLLGGRGARDLLPLALDSLRAELKSIGPLPPGRRGDFFYLTHALRRSFQDQLTVQRSAIEVRCPFFDYAFADFIYSLPTHIRINPVFQRAVLTKRMPRLVLVPYERNNRLPHSNPWVYHSYALVQRVKHRINRHVAPIFRDRPRLYADYENYLRTDLRQWAEAILFDPRTLARGLFNPDAVRALWERHLSGAEQWTIGKVAPLISIELALRHLFDGDEHVGREAPRPDGLRPDAEAFG